MNQKWIIYSDAGNFGPWSSSRIRDELRAGRLDPFDLVSAEGSAIKRHLIEVDVIFDSTKIQSAEFLEDTAADVAPMHGRRIGDVKKQASRDSSAHATEQVARINERPESISPPPLNLKHGQTIVTVDAPKSPEISEYRPRAFEALASPDRIIDHQRRPNISNIKGAHRSPQKNQARGQRRYLVGSYGRRPQGPFTSKEILMLWYAGKVTRKSFIQCIGDVKKIDIVRFVRVYEQAQPMGQTVFGHAKLVGQYRDWSLIWMIVAIIISLIVITGAYLWKKSNVNPELSADFIGSNSSSNSSPNSSSETNSNSKSDEPVEPQKLEVPTIIASPAPAPKDLIIPPLKLDVKREVKPKKRNLTRPDPIESQREIVRSKSRTSLSTSPTAKPLAAYPAPVKISTQVTPKSLSNPSTKPWIDGSTVTLANYKFNANFLVNCQVKCKIPMSGPQGPVTVIFIKSAFGSALATKSTGVAIVGTVRKDTTNGAISIILQSLK